MGDKSRLSSAHLIYKMSTEASAWLCSGQVSDCDWLLAVSYRRRFLNFLRKHWSIHLFIHQILTKWLVFAKHCSRYWRYSSEENRWTLSFRGAYVLVGWQTAVLLNGTQTMPVKAHVQLACPASNNTQQNRSAVGRPAEIKTDNFPFWSSS